MAVLLFSNIVKIIVVLIGATGQVSLIASIEVLALPKQELQAYNQTLADQIRKIG